MCTPPHSQLAGVQSAARESTTRRQSSSSRRRVGDACACLRSWPKTLVVVSHARNFLNEVATDVIHLHSRKMVTYRGNFDTFEKTAHERLKNARKQAESQQAAKEHMQVWLPLLRASSHGSTGVRVSRLATMREVLLPCAQQCALLCAGRWGTAIG